MSVILAELPYAMDALEPHISKETIEYHYGKHHKAYVDNLNKLIAGTDLDTKPLVDVIKSSTGPIFNNAAQVYNHSFYWQCLAPQAGGEPTAQLLQLIIKNFGSFAEFKEKFTASCLTLFGAGWTWLVQDEVGALAILNTSNAVTPITEGKTPLLTCDVWEHAYYIDYRNMRAKYVESFWQLVNWNFVASQIIV